MSWSETCEQIFREPRLLYGNNVPTLVTFVTLKFFSLLYSQLYTHYNWNTFYSISYVPVSSLGTVDTDEVYIRLPICIFLYLTLCNLSYVLPSRVCVSLSVGESLEVYSPKTFLQTKE